MFCQYHIVLSPVSLSWASWCFAYYKLLFSFNFPTSNLPQPPHHQGVFSVILNCCFFGFFFDLPPSRLNCTSFITCPSSLKPSVSPPSMPSTDHRWLLCSYLSTCEPCKGFISLSTLSPAVPAPETFAGPKWGTPAPSDRSIKTLFHFVNVFKTYLT